jgi:hypothetical protein
MALYNVKSSIRRNGQNYTAGDTIELPEDEAARMPWAVELAPEQSGTGVGTESETKGEFGALPPIEAHPVTEVQESKPVKSKKGRK